MVLDSVFTLTHKRKLAPNFAELAQEYVTTLDLYSM